MQFSVVESWASVEADFLREYNIDLVRDLDNMSWRRFQILLRGLSPNSATVVRVTSGQTFGKGDKRVNKVEGTKATQSAFEMLFKPPSRPS